MDAKKVLVIDDERLIVKSTGLALKFFGFIPLEAQSGDIGLALAERDHPDIILLDIMMPGMDGWEVLVRLKESDTTRDIPVILFTAKEYANGPTLALAKGASGYLAKPFEPDALKRLLLEHLEKKGATPC